MKIPHGIAVYLKYVPEGSIVKGQSRPGPSGAWKQ